MKIELVRKNETAEPGRQGVSIRELFSNEFMQACTPWQTMDEMFDASGFPIRSKEDFEAIPPADWDAFIADATEYASWEELLKEAGAHWVARSMKT